ncbi:MAG TPA: AAA family ATPase [Pyrinomonadaceae bacterium]|jgi:hypothetical protein|nr:AAA family ATPase [Pyrinomonadaceae bacterium]
MRDDLFENVARAPGQHFRLYFYAAVLHLIEHLIYSFDSWEEVAKQFPFLEGYYQELALHGAGGMTLEDALASWRASLLAYEDEATGHLPLAALGDAAGLGYDALVLLLTANMVEEDVRFGAVFDALQPGAHRQGPSLGLLYTWRTREEEGGSARRLLRRLQELGLLNVANGDAPRSEHVLHVHPLVWDAIQGEAGDRALAPWVRQREAVHLAEADALIVPEALRAKTAALPALLASGEAQALVVRGPQHNGRRTLAGAVARALGRGVLEAGGLGGAEDARWRLLGALATLTGSMPLVVLDLGPGEAAEIPALGCYTGPLAVVLGRQGGLRGEGVERAITVTLEMPEASARLEHWRSALGERDGAGEVEEIAARFRMTGGNIRRAAGLARAYASLEGRSDVTADDVQRASRDLNRQALDTLAVRVETSGSWESLAVKPETLRELESLERRCRSRERLREAVGEDFGRQLNAGVRALFCGPSGTGKTLAARLLASVLKMDLYRLDLSSVVNKYIGETEKSLNQIFARAEELDVVLLLDEGDSLLTQRTNVQSSNDRYANLETNYLLQRLESFEGILLITTNAADRIDSAFQRRMDVIVEFRAPEPAEMLAIWGLHLPQKHAVGQNLLGEVSRRCSLSGGQIRNAVLHASLLALSNGGTITSEHLEAAVRREYSKEGAVCPLRSAYAEAFNPN